jgi:hypothetical protein
MGFRHPGTRPPTPMRDRAAEGRAESVARGEPPAPGGRVARATAPAELGLGPGQPLPKAERSYFEQRLGTDLSEVRVHPEATATSALNADAFATGRDIGFAPGQWRPGTGEGRRLLGHELGHVLEQGSAGSPVLQLQERQPPDPLAERPAADIMADPQYFENGIVRIEFFSAELAILHYGDGGSIRVGLVPEQIEAPIEAVDYRTPRSMHLPVAPAGEGLGRGSIRFIPRATEIRAPAGMGISEVADRAGRIIRFVRHPSGHIVPTELNTLSAPRLCQALREAEAEYVRRTDAMARGMVETLHVLEWIIILASLGEALLAGAGRSAAAEGAGAAGAEAGAGILARAEAQLARILGGLLRSGAAGEATVEGVGLGGLRASLRGSELVARYSHIINIGRTPGMGRMVHGALERAAIEVARQSGARTARVAVEMVQNPAWRAYLESQGYALEVIAGEGGSLFTSVWTRVFTL